MNRGPQKQMVGLKQKRMLFFKTLKTGKHRQIVQMNMPLRSDMDSDISEQAFVPHLCISLPRPCDSYHTISGF